MINKLVISGRNFKVKNFFREQSFLLAVLGAVLIWSASFVATKVAFRTFPPLTLAAVRFSVAAAGIGSVLVIRGELTLPARQDLYRLLVSGLLGITIYFAMENWGVQLATAGDASLIVAAYPAITMLLEWVIYRVAVLPARFGGVVLAMLGVYLIVRESSNIGGSHRLGGDLILVATGIVWSFYNFVTRKVVNKYPTIQITFYQTLAGAIALIPLAFLERGLWRPLRPETFAALLYLGIFCSLIGFLLYAYGLKRLGSSSAVTLMNLVPVFGVIFSALFLHETMSTLQYLGGLIVISGIILSVRMIRQDPKGEENGTMSSG